MSCAACGTANVAGAKFCQECGSALATGCASCGAVLAPGAKFCSECGARVGSSAATPAGAGASTGAAGASPGSGAVAERRLVSVLFADLVGFTPFSEERDSEEVRETLTRYFAIASEVIEAHGGTVEKFIGDAVMAVWGTPVAREDDAERSVRAALELLDAIKGLGLGITARAGVLTGEAAVTIGATNQGMVAGDIVNTAARLQSVAAPGTVLVGEATYRAASAAIAFEEAGARTLKGKDEPVGTWRALRVIAERGGRNRSDGLEPPFVGRDDELRMLKEAFNATAREGRARLVSITGPAGIGKSRLAWEFGRYLDGVVDSVWWHHGRSPAYGQGITFWALGEMVRSRAGVTEGADETATRAAVDRMLAEHLADATEQAWVRPAILALLGIEGEKVGADELFARWRLLFERMSATGTVALVFEDLHWADPATLDFIDHLLDWSKSFPILVVTLARPELLDRRPDWGTGRRSFVGIALEPLPDGAMRQLLLGVAPGLPPDAVTRIVARAEGMPLYAVETLRMLVTDRRLVLQDGVYVAVGDVSDIAVPETLTALIAARLDALEPADRTLVLDAAVLGQSFTPDGLAAVSGLPRETVDGRLRTLMRRELFTIEADPRSPERGQYAFVQALIREVAYNTLARRDRKDRHLAAARYFEAMGSDELAGALAGHFLAAYELSNPGPEADALAAQARISLLAAVDRAMALRSHAQAVQLIGQAQVVSPDPSDRAALDERLGAALLTAGDYAGASEAYARATAHYREVGDRIGAVRTLERSADVLLVSKRSTEARPLLEQAVEEFADLGTARELIALRAQLARSAYFEGDLARAVPLADEVLAIAEPEGMLEVVSDTLISKGTVFGNLGRPLEGLALIRAALDIANEHGFTGQQLRAYTNLSVVIQELDPAAGMEATVEGLALARRLGSETYARNFVGNLGFAGYRTGQWNEVVGELEAAIEERYGGADLGLVLTNLITIRGAQGHDPEPLLELMRGTRTAIDAELFRIWLADMEAFVASAESRYADAARILTGVLDVAEQAWPQYRIVAARFTLCAGDAEGAAELLRGATSAYLRYPTWRANLEALRACADASTGDVPTRIAAAVAQRARLDELGLVADAALVAIDMAHAFGAGEPQVEAALRDARAFYERVDGRAFIRQIDELLGAISTDGAGGRATTAAS